MKMRLLGGLRLLSLVVLSPADFAGRPSNDLESLIKTRRPQRRVSESERALERVAAWEKSIYAKPLF